MMIVTDRGPAKRLGREIDLSRAAFARLAPLKLGLIEVKVERIDGFGPRKSGPNLDTSK